MNFGKNPGSTAALAVFVASVVFAFASSIIAPDLQTMILLLGGTIAGLLTISEKESVSFIIAVVGLAVVSGSANVGLLGALGTMFHQMFANLLYAFAPVTLFVIVKTLWRSSQN